MLADVCAAEGVFYMASAKRQVVALRSEDGCPLWETKLPAKACSGIAIDGEYVWVPPYVLSRKTGEVVFNIEEQTPYRRPGYSYGFGVGRNFFWEVAEPGPGLCGFYPGEKAQFYPITLTDMHAWNDSRMFGIHEGKAVCLELETGTVRWERDLPKAQNDEPMVCGHSLINIGDRVYIHVNYDTLWCIDGESGEFVWKSGPDEIAKNAVPHESEPPSSFLACNDRIYLGKQIYDQGFLQCHDIADGRQLWSVPVKEPRFGPIVGDVLFGVTEDVPVAWDRYTGEMIWRAEEGMVATVFAAAEGNKVIYTATTGMVSCYEWNVSYRSPFRNNSGADDRYFSQPRNSRSF